jgi:hypothetical protein
MTTIDISVLEQVPTPLQYLTTNCWKERIMAKRKVAREIWRAIPGHDGYEVSSLGRVRSINRVMLKRSRHPGLFLRKYRGRILALQAAGFHKNYLAVGLGYSPQNHQYVHRIVMLAFEGKPKRGYEVHHIDHNPRNNSLSNLKYVTRSENNFAIRRPKKERCRCCGRTIRCYDADTPARDI